MYCKDCACWGNDLNNDKLLIYKSTDADIGNGFCEIGICKKSGNYKYFDNKCDLEV